MIKEIEIDGLLYLLNVDVRMATVKKSVDKECTEVNIPASIFYEGGKYLVNVIDFHAFEDCHRLTTIHIPHTVRAIGDAAFLDCDSLSSIIIPRGVEYIGDWTFSGCSSLTTINLPQGIRGIGDRAFNSCSSLTAINIPEGASFIGDGAFFECSSLTTIFIPRSMKFIGKGAFTGCSNLETVIFFGETTIEEEVFVSCEKLANIYCCSEMPSKADKAFTGIDLTSLTLHISECYMEQYQNSSLWSEFGTIVPIRNFGNSVEIDGLIYYKYGRRAVMMDCIDKKRTTAIIPMFITIEGVEYEVISIGKSSLVREGNGHGFRDCCRLTSVLLPESVAEIGKYAFLNCHSLTSVNIPERVEIIEEKAFAGCIKLSSITIPARVVRIGEFAFECCSNLTAITIPESVTSIGNGAFSGCSSLTAITIPESVTSIGNGAFSGCSSLTAITIPESVTSIKNGAFKNCNKLTSIVVAERNTKYDSRNGCNAIIDTQSNILIAGCKTTIIPTNVTSIGEGAFASCSSLTDITIPESVTSIGDMAFSSCCNLTINIPAWVEMIGKGAFCDVHAITVDEKNARYDSRDNCNAIIETSSNTLVAGTNNTIIPESVTKIGDHAFSGCSKLATITIPESVASIGDWAFYNCMSLNTTIPEGVVDIGQYAFEGCYNIDNLIIPKSVKNIGRGAFEGCTIKSLTLFGNPSIEDEAFFYCDWLTDIYCYSEEVPSAEDCFFSLNSFTLHVPERALEAYKNEYAWSCGFGTIVPIK